MCSKVHKQRLARLAGLVALAAIAASAQIAAARADNSVNTGYFGGVAIMGYDPVAYFTDGKAVKGSDKISYDWLGTPWHFASDEHRKMFMSTPVKFAPQYGGYCAGEVAGSATVTVDIDPNAFKIIDGKLYLTYDEVHTDEFAARAGEQVPKADDNWPTVKANLELDHYY